MYGWQMSFNKFRKKNRMNILLFPIDEKSKPIEDLDSKIMENINTLAIKRTQYIKRQLVLNDVTINDMLEAAYIQGLTDTQICLLNLEKRNGDKRNGDN